jgi:hypothetical protein
VASVNWIPTPLAAASLLLAAAVSGCATTQDANQRASIQADRTIASRQPLAFKGSSPDVRVVDTSVVRGRDGSAIVVVLRNTGDAPVNDLPLEVGLRGGRPLNVGANVPYFQSHAPAIAPGEEATWVYPTKDRLESGSAFARVAGPPADTPKADRVPELQVSDSGFSPSKDGGSVRAEVTNDSGVPQYGLDVYAVARKHGRYVAAGRTSLAHLGVSKSAHLTLTLVGDAKGADVQIFVPPTLFE